MARILLVERDRAAIQQIWEWLENSPHTIAAIAQNSTEAENWAINHPTDLALVSFSLLQQTNGMRGTSHLAALHIPIIYRLDPGEEIEVLAHPPSDAAGYLAPPYSRAALLLTIDTALRMGQQQLHRSQTNELLQRQAERERIIWAITRQIHQSLHLDEILTRTVHEVSHLLQADRVAIYQFAADWSGAVIAESVQGDWTPMLGHRIFDPCLIPEQCLAPYQCGYIGNTEDIYQAGLASCYVDLLAQFQVRANLVVPILQTGALWGFLVCQQCAAPRKWQSWEVDLLVQLAEQVAIALQQAHLYQQVQGLNTRLEEQIQERTHQLQQAYHFEATLKRITDRVRDTLDEAYILQTALEELAQALGAHVCNAATYDLEQRISTIRYEYNLANTPFLVSKFQSYSVAMDEFPEGYRQLLQGQGFQFCAKLSGTSEEWVSRLACPIQDDQGVLGDLWLIHRANFAFSEQDIRLVEQVANQCAIAIRQSRLFTEVQAQITALERLNQLKDDFLSTVSHELRTPITNIRVALQMLEVTLEQGNEFSHPKIQRYLQILKQECQRESQLINDLLDIARLEQTIEPLELETFNLVDQIRLIAEKFAGPIQKAQQQLHLEFEQGSLMLTTRLSYFERILSELLDNACKYSPSEATIRVTIQRARLDATSPVLIQVSNSGVEIPAEELPRIFDRFYRIPNHNPWRHSGTGLGLALVQKLVHLLGGTIQVQSASQITTFTIQFPNNPLDYSTAI